ncbi:MAG: polysaccharide deacetylase family protein [Actinobacteria bacterium]|nr:polysaccharide deacetylase family protein [Actinomycetota bacterium]
MVFSALALVLVLAGFGLLMLSNARSFQLFGKLTDRVDTGRKVAALTFDDGPAGNTGEVLDILRDKNAKATFYVIGQSVELYPDQTRAIAARGHELGNHSYSHSRLILKSPSRVELEIEKTNELIRGAGYAGEITFRPPYGKKLVVLPWYLSRNNIETVMWDVEPDTEHAGDAGAILDYTLEKTEPGSIILLHPFGPEGSADIRALPEIIDGLREEGYSFVTVSELKKMDSEN